jgi:4'-phosphopantetheinyl transferase
VIADGKINWPVPAEFPVLRSGEIHLWCACLGKPDDPKPAGTASLSPDEIARAGSFYFAPDRHRYVAARRNLRDVLAGYLGENPAALNFGYGPFGKPALLHQAALAVPGNPPVSDLEFNQSHCDSLWLLAVAWQQPVGVDLEELADLPDLALIERGIFSPAELPRQQSLPPTERQRAFFHRWTLREAAVKYRGLGLDSASPFAPPDQSEFFSPTDHSVGCLAYGGASLRVQRFGWHPDLVRHSWAKRGNRTPVELLGTRHRE